MFRKFKFRTKDKKSSSFVKTNGNNDNTGSSSMMNESNFSIVNQSMPSLIMNGNNNIAFTLPNKSTAYCNHDKFGTMSSVQSSTIAKSIDSTMGKSETASSLQDDEMSMLDGTLQLKFYLPNGNVIGMEVEAKTPMMDLLVQVTTKNGLNPGGMYLKAASDRPPGYIHYKANTPVGRLNCQEFAIVPKSDLFDRPKVPNVPGKSSNLPFEPTVRLSIDLPRGQKTFVRVNPDLPLHEVLLKVCQQAESFLEQTSTLQKPDLHDQYTLRLAKHPDVALDERKSVRQIGSTDFLLRDIRQQDQQPKYDHSAMLKYYTQMAMMEEAKPQPEPKRRGFFGLFRRKNNKKDKNPTLHRSLGNLHDVTTTSTPDVEPPIIKETKNLAHIRSNLAFCAPNDSVEENDINIVERSGKKRSAPKPPVKATEKYPEKPIHAPLSSFANDQDAQPLTICSAEVVRQDSDASSGYYDDGQARQTPSPNTDESSTRTTLTRDSAACTGRSVSPSSSNDKPKHTESPPLSPVLPSDANAAVVHRTPSVDANQRLTSAQTMTSTPKATSEDFLLNESSAATKRKSRAPPPPCRLEDTSHETERRAVTLSRYIEMPPLVLPNDASSQRESQRLNEIYCLLSVRGGNIIEEDSLGGSSRRTDIMNQGCDSQRLGVDTWSVPVSQRSDYEGGDAHVDADDSQRTWKIMKDMMMTMEMECGETAMMEKSEEYPQSALNKSVDEAADARIVREIGSGDAEERCDQFKKPAVVNLNESVCSGEYLLPETPPPVQKSITAKEDQLDTVTGDVSTKNYNNPSSTVVYNDPKRHNYPPSMRVKSFEDEYYNSSGRNFGCKQPKQNDTGIFGPKNHFTMNEHLSVEKQLERMKRNGYEELTVLPQCEPIPDVVNNDHNVIKCKVDEKLDEQKKQQLQLQYDVLQKLYNEWKLETATGNDDSSTFQSTLDMLRVQRLQTRVLEQHQIVQELYNAVYTPDQAATMMTSCDTKIDNDDSLSVASSSLVFGNRLLRMTSDLNKFSDQAKQKAIIVPYRSPKHKSNMKAPPAPPTVPPLAEIIEEMKSVKLKSVDGDLRFDAKKRCVSKKIQYTQSQGSEKGAPSKGDLLQSIRQFGGAPGLRKTKSTVETNN